jgi:hypothetical protein
MAYTISVGAIAPDTINSEDLADYDHFHIAAHQTCGCTDIRSTDVTEPTEIPCRGQGCDWEFIYGWGEPFDGKWETLAEAQKFADRIIEDGTVPPGFAPGFIHAHWRLSFTRVTPDMLWVIGCSHPNCCFDIVLDGHDFLDYPRRYWTGKTPKP